MDRRTFVSGLALSIATPPPAPAQPATKIYRLGYLTPAAPPVSPTVLLEARGPFRLALRELGYVQGQNLAIELRYAEGKIERLPALAAELVQLRVDVVVAAGPVAIQAAKDATKTIPIVMGFAGSTDPVERGFVASLARPGGNITGVTMVAGTLLAGKGLELLKEMVPRVKRIAVLTTDESGPKLQVVESHKAAALLGVRLVVVEARHGDYEKAFATMVAERADALFVVSSAILNRDRRRIIGLAAKHRLPAIYEWSEHTEEGGLMAYGSNLSGLYRRVAAHVDRIFKGANPAELLVEQPTVFELTVNRRTAKALGLTIPPGILARADHVIE
jgi:putative ABC transport system substrate-binding protein